MQRRHFTETFKVCKLRPQSASIEHYRKFEFFSTLSSELPQSNPKASDGTDVDYNVLNMSDFESEEWYKESACYAFQQMIK